MYRLLFILSFSLASITSAHAASESPLTGDAAWKEYQKLLENYYFLDKQETGHVSCRVSVPELQASINRARQKLGKKLTINENLSDWSVIYDRTNGVSFNSPHIKVSVLPDVKPDEAERLENVQKMIQKVLDGGISTEENLISGYLKDMITTSYSPQKQRHLSLTKNGNVTVVSFDSGDENIKISYSGTTQKETILSPTYSTTSTSDYQLLNGKLAISHFTMETKKGATKTIGAESTSYQDLGSTFFFAQILYDQSVSEGAQQSKPQHLEIDFKDCKTSNVSP